MLTPFLMAILLIFFITLSWVLSVAETALAYVSRKQAEGIVMRKLKNPVLVVMERLPEHLHALRFWRLFTETTAAVLVALLLDFFINNAWISAAVATVAMALVCLLLVIWSPRAVGARKEVTAVEYTARLVRFLTAILGPLPAKFATPGFRAETDEEETAEMEERHFREYVSRANDADVLEDAEAELIQSVFDMGDTIVRTVMVPRTDVVTVEAGTSLEDTLNLFLRSGTSRMPVIGDDADDVGGMVYLKDTVRALHNRKMAPDSAVDTVVRPVRFVPESKTVSVLLQELQREATHIAIVVDEYGGTAGLVTLEDLIEEIVGDISDEYDRRDIPDIQPITDGEFLLSARMSASDFVESFNLHLDDDDDDVDTVGGLLAKHLGRVPIEGSKVELGGVRLQVNELEGRRNRVSTIRLWLDPARHPSGRASTDTAALPIPPATTAAHEEKQQS